MRRKSAKPQLREPKGLALDVPGLRPLYPHGTAVRSRVQKVPGTVYGWYPKEKLYAVILDQPIQVSFNRVPARTSVVWIPEDSLENADGTIPLRSQEL